MLSSRHSIRYQEKFKLFDPVLTQEFDIFLPECDLRWPHVTQFELIKGQESDGVPINQDVMINTLTSYVVNEMTGKPILFQRPQMTLKWPHNDLEMVKLFLNSDLMMKEPSQAGIIDPNKNLQEQLDKIGVEGDPNDTELFPLSGFQPMVEIDIVRTDAQDWFSKKYVINHDS